MKSSDKRKSIVVALWGNALLLGAILVVLLHRQSSPNWLPLAFGDDVKPTTLSPQPIAGGGGVFLMPAQFSDHVWGCYLMDIDHQTLVAYTCSGSPLQLRLTAARNFGWDLKLKDWNTEKPRPDEVRQWIEKEREANRANTTKSVPPPAEVPAKQD